MKLRLQAFIYAWSGRISSFLFSYFLTKNRELPLYCVFVSLTSCLSSFFNSCPCIRIFQSSTQNTSFHCYSSVRHVSATYTATPHFQIHTQPKPMQIFEAIIHLFYFHLVSKHVRDTTQGLRQYGTYVLRHSLGTMLVVY